MTIDTTTTRPGGLSNKAYDTLKYIALVALPGSGALYFALASIWNLPFATEVIGTISAVDVFLGLLLGISTSKFKKSDAVYDGEILVNEDGRVALSAPNLTLEELVARKSVTLKAPEILHPGFVSDLDIEGETPSMGSR